MFDYQLTELTMTKYISLFALALAMTAPAFAATPSKDQTATSTEQAQTPSAEESEATPSSEDASKSASSKAAK